MTEATETPRATSSSRRTLLKGAVAGAGALWVAPTIDSFVSPAAAASTPTSATSALRKEQNNAPNATPAGRCVQGCNGDCSNVVRGSVTFNRSAGGSATICVTLTLSSGPDVTGRSIYILQSNGTTCLAQSLAGTWASSPANGPQQFCASVAAGATFFSVHMPASGGGGTEIYSSDAVNLP